MAQKLINPLYDIIMQGIFYFWENPIKMKKIILLLFLVQFGFSQEPVHFKEALNGERIEVYIGNELFTSYLKDSDNAIKKPVLYPILSPGNHLITRGWPLDPREGERTDHPHHVGMWLNNGDVNTNDFWNNSYERDQSKHHYGTIVHTKVNELKGGKKKGSLKVTAIWKGYDNKELLEENTTFTFSGTASVRIIDRITTLKALDKVLMKDNKEGMLAIRLAKELEHDDPKMTYKTSGKYLNDFGVEGMDVWGKRSAWMNLTGKIEDENLSVLVLDHPKNANYPAHWHARGYGLYAVNNIGSEIFTDGKENSDIELNKGEKVTFKYRVVIASKHLSENEILSYVSDFEK